MPVNCKPSPLGMGIHKGEKQGRPAYTLLKVKGETHQPRLKVQDESRYPTCWRSACASLILPPMTKSSDTCPRLRNLAYLSSLISCSLMTLYLHTTESVWAGALALGRTFCFG